MAQLPSATDVSCEKEKISLLPYLPPPDSPLQPSTTPVNFLSTIPQPDDPEYQNIIPGGGAAEIAAYTASDNPRDQADPPAVSTMLWPLAKKSAVLVCLGIGIMVASIGIVQAIVLPKIYTCPPNATCPDSFSPNSSNVLQLLQTFMTYCLRAGMMVASFGLIRLGAYQSWFILVRDGNTTENLDYNLGALKGNSIDACRLIFRKGMRGVSALVLGLFLVDTAISLVIGLSITWDSGERSVTFTYSDVSFFPDSSTAGLNSDGQKQAIALVEKWALSNNTAHGAALRGSLAIPDSRSNYSVRMAPGGPLISGAISCVGVDNYTIVDNNSSLHYNIYIRDHVYFALPDMKLAVTMTSYDTARANYLWVSNTLGLLPNGTLTSDGNMTIALCNHTVFMVNVSQVAGVQYINPNVAVTSGCDSTVMDVCVADSVSNTVLSWWGGLGQNFWRFSCRGSVAGPLAADGNTDCSLTTGLWKEIVTSVLDGIMQSAPTTGVATQQLVVSIKNIDGGRWWLQGTIPLCIVLLYAVALYYTCRVSQGHHTFKELDLSEVIGAAQVVTDDILSHPGELKKAVLRFRSTPKCDNA